MIRFTPRKLGSIWSAVNVGRVGVLAQAGRIEPAGLAAFEGRKEARTGIYSHEQASVELPEADLARFREAPAAWQFFQAQPGSYRKAASWWVVSARQDATRRRRLEKLVEHSARAEQLPQFTRKKPTA